MSSISMDEGTNIEANTNSTAPRNAHGWDGKLRIDKKATLTNPEALSDPEYSDEEAPLPEVIEADEDLLEDFEDDADEIDLVHRRVSSIPALHLERCQKVDKLCLRQNSISRIDFPKDWGECLTDLDLYDNVISHIKGLDNLRNITSLDLSFNNIKHIKNVNHLKKLTDLYFVQNKIQKIEGLDGLSHLRNLELAGNRIRDIEGLDDLIGLEELWLGKNKIQELKNISHLPKLDILSLPSNRLTVVPSLPISLTELYVSHNMLARIPELPPNLRVLDISNNKIHHLENLATASALEELWASSNNISSFEEVEGQLGGLQSFQAVYFEHNPLQTSNPVLYRNKVRLALPKIKQIDATYVQV